MAMEEESAGRPIMEARARKQHEDTQKRAERAAKREQYAWLKETGQLGPQPAG